MAASVDCIALAPRTPIQLADRAWERATKLARCRVPAVARSHLVWRWCSHGKWCWREFALQPRQAGGDAQNNISHFVLGWVGGEWAGKKAPWWESACTNHATLPRLSLWQAPTRRFDGRPNQVDHRTLQVNAGRNTSKGMVWAVWNDMVRRGQCPRTPQGFVTVFDMQVQEFVVADLAREDVRAALHSRPLPSGFECEWFPQALYHGTGGDLRWLSKEGGGRLRNSTEGMLGSGVYLGSFTKAVRFAGFSRNASEKTEYSARGSEEVVAILRVLVFVREEKIKRLNQGGDAAYFSRLFSVKKRKQRGEEYDAKQARAWTDARRAPYNDARSVWRQQRFDAVALLPTCVGVNPYSDKDIWVVRNEEWCVRSSATLVRNVADLHLETVTLDPWLPWRRSAAIR